MPNSAFAAGLTPEQLGEIVREAYRKHAAELLAIEEAQQKLVLLLLAVFGGGASFLASENASSMEAFWPRLGLAILIVAFLAVAGVYTHHRNKARKAVRDLLLKCDEALGFFEPNLYLESAQLYEDKYKVFPKEGGWLGWTYWLAVMAGMGFLIVLFSPWLSRAGG